MHLAVAEPTVAVPTDDNFAFHIISDTMNMPLCGSVVLYHYLCHECADMRKAIALNMPYTYYVQNAWSRIIFTPSNCCARSARARAHTHTLAAHRTHYGKWFFYVTIILGSNRLYAQLWFVRLQILYCAITIFSFLLLNNYSCLP